MFWLNHLEKQKHRSISFESKIKSTYHRQQSRCGHSYNPSQISDHHPKKNKKITSRDRRFNYSDATATSNNGIISLVFFFIVFSVKNTLGDLWFMVEAHSI